MQAHSRRLHAIRKGVITEKNVARVLTRILKTGFIESIPGKSWSQN